MSPELWSPVFSNPSLSRPRGCSCHPGTGRRSWGLRGAQAWVEGKGILMRTNPALCPQSRPWTQLVSTAGWVCPEGPVRPERLHSDCTPRARLPGLRAVGPDVTHWLGRRGPCPEPAHPVKVPSSALVGADLAAAGLYLDAGRARGTLGRGWGGGPWPSVFCATRALVGYRNLA